MSGTKEYLKKFFDLQRLRWHNYADDAGHEVLALEAEIYKLLEHPAPVSGDKRQALLWNLVRRRELIEMHPRVGELRNWFDSAADERDLPKAKANALELLHLRDTLSRAAGASSYAELALESQELSLPVVEGILSDYLLKHAFECKGLANKYGIRWPTWHDDLRRIGGDYFPERLDSIMEKLLSRLGLSGVRGNIRVFVKQASGVSGYTGVLHVPDDIRIVVRPASSLDRVRTFFHETGHALYHACNRESGILTTWDAATDEGMAVLMEHVAATLVMDEKQRSYFKDIALLESMRCAASFMFEIALCRNPDAAEELYSATYGRLGITVDKPQRWPLDTFRTVDPMTIHCYVLGELFARHTVQFMARTLGEDYLRWGSWLEKTMYAPGRGLSFAQRAALVGWKF
jgi:hypothetical protein